MLVSNQGYRNNIDYKIARETVDLLSKKNLDLGKSEIISSAQENKTDETLDRKLFTFKKLENEFSNAIESFISEIRESKEEELYLQPFGENKFARVSRDFKNYYDYFKINIFKTFLTSKDNKFKDEVIQSFENVKNLFNENYPIFNFILINIYALSPNNFYDLKTEQDYNKVKKEYEEYMKKANEIYELLNSSKSTVMTEIPAEIENLVDFNFEVYDSAKINQLTNKRLDLGKTISNTIQNENEKALINGLFNFMDILAMDLIEKIKGDDYETISSFILQNTPKFKALSFDNVYFTLMRQIIKLTTEYIQKVDKIKISVPNNQSIYNAIKNLVRSIKQKYEDSLYDADELDERNYFIDKLDSEYLTNAIFSYIYKLKNIPVKFKSTDINWDDIYYDITTAKKFINLYQQNEEIFSSQILQNINKNLNYDSLYNICLLILANRDFKVQIN